MCGIACVLDIRTDPKALRERALAMVFDPAEKMVARAGSRNTPWGRSLKVAFRKASFGGKQFLDGVGYSWIDMLKAYAEAKITDVQLQNAEYRFPYNPPATKEAYLYREIFEHQFPSEAAAACVPGGPSIACSTPAVLAWDETFRRIANPSGRSVIGVHRGVGGGFEAGASEESEL